jgi:hypothetical protein
MSVLCVVCAGVGTRAQGWSAQGLCVEGVGVGIVGSGECGMRRAMVGEDDS